jgi:hypothetical protein
MVFGEGHGCVLLGQKKGWFELGSFSLLVPWSFIIEAVVCLGSYGKASLELTAVLAPPSG